MDIVNGLEMGVVAPSPDNPYAYVIPRPAYKEVGRLEKRIIALETEVSELKEINKKILLLLEQMLGGGNVWSVFYSFYREYN